MRRHLYTFVAVVALIGAVSVLTRAHDITLNGTVLFSSLDGSADDHDGAVNGVFTVNDGNLPINGSVTCNDDAPLSNNASACSAQ